MHKFIPIKQKDYLLKDLYYYSGYIRHLTKSQFSQADEEEKKITTLTYLSNSSQDLQRCGEKLGICYNSRKRHLGNYPAIIKTIDEAVSLLPFDVYDKLIAEMDADEMNVLRKTYMLRVYFYYYWNCCCFGNHFQRSAEVIAADIGTNQTNLNNATKWLVTHNFLKKNGKYKFTGEQTFTYWYSIPEDCRIELS